IGMEVGDVVFRHVITYGVEDLRRDHLCAGLKVGVADGVELDKVRLAPGILYHHSRGDSRRFGFRNNNGTEVGRASSVRASLQFLGAHAVEVMTIRVPTGVRHLIQLIHIRCLLWAAGSAPYPSRNIKSLFSAFDDLSLKEVVVVSGWTFFRLRNIFHIKVKPENLRGIYFSEADKPREQCRCDD